MLKFTTISKKRETSYNEAQHFQFSSTNSNHKIHCNSQETTKVIQLVCVTILTEEEFQKSSCLVWEQHNETVLSL